MNIIEIKWRFDPMNKHEENLLIDIIDHLNEAVLKIEALLFDSDLSEWKSRLEVLMTEIDMRLEKE